MNDLVSESLLLISAFALIVVMVLVIVKERRKQMNVGTKGKMKNAKRKLRTESEGLYLD